MVFILKKWFVASKLRVNYMNLMEDITLNFVDIYMHRGYNEFADNCLSELVS